MLLKEGQIWQVLSLVQELTLDTWKPEGQGNAIVVFLNTVKKKSDMTKHLTQSISYKIQSFPLWVDSFK